MRILPYLHDQTTTGLIDRIRQRDLLPVDDGNERQRRSGATIGGREPAIQEEALIQNPKSKIQNQGSDPLLESAGHYGYG